MNQSITFKKGDISIEIQKKDGGILVRLSKKNSKESKIFSLVDGKIFILSDKKEWKLIDTRSVGIKRDYVDKNDRGSVELVETLGRFPLMNPSPNEKSMSGMADYLYLEEDEKILLEAIIYDLYAGRNLDWFIYPEALYYEFLKNRLAVVFPDHSVIFKDMPSKTKSEFTSFPEDLIKNNNEKINLPVLPPITRQDSLGGLEKQISKLSVKKNNKQSSILAFLPKSK